MDEKWGYPYFRKPPRALTFVHGLHAAYLLRASYMLECTPHVESFLKWSITVLELVWVNYNDLTATSLGMMVSKGNHPNIDLIQVSELL